MTKISHNSNTSVPFTLPSILNNLDFYQLTRSQYLKIQALKISTYLLNDTIWESVPLFKIQHPKDSTFLKTCDNWAARVSSKPYFYYPIISQGLAWF